MSVPLNTSLDGVYLFRKAGVLFDPTPLPTLTEAFYPDGTSRTGLPLALTHPGTGEFTLTGVFPPNLVAQIGSYISSAYTSDTTVDQQSVGYEWVDVGDPVIAAIKGKTDIIGTGQAISALNTLIGVVDHIRPGDDYKQVDGTHKYFTFVGPSIIGAQSITLTYTLALGQVVTITGYVIAANQPGWDIPRVTSATMTTPGKWKCIATLANGDIKELASGDVVIDP